MESVIAKLQKLLNHERSARSIGNTHEAEAFAAKIADMLFAHKLTMSEVEIAQEEHDQPVSEETLESVTAPWMGLLALGVCSASFCEVLRSHRGYVFIGRPMDRAAAVSMYRYLATMGNSICESEMLAYRHSDAYLYDSSFRPGILRTWKVSFLRGYANAIHRRLAAERKILTAQAESSGTSLVYIGKSEKAIADYCQTTYGKLRKSRSSSSNTHGGAYSAGQQAGSRVSLKSQGALTA